MCSATTEGYVDLPTAELNQGRKTVEQPWIKSVTDDELKKTEVEKSIKSQRK